MLTREVVPLLYNKLLMEPLILNLEDLYITGFIAEEIGITRRKAREFYNHRFPKLPVITICDSNSERHHTRGITIVTALIVSRYARIQDVISPFLPPGEWLHLWGRPADS